MNSFDPPNMPLMRDFQPMNANYGLFPPIASRERGRDKRRVLAARAGSDLQQWIAAHAIEPQSAAVGDALPA